MTDKEIAVLGTLYSSCGFEQSKPSPYLEQVRMNQVLHALKGLQQDLHNQQYPRDPNNLSGRAKVEIVDDEPGELTA